MSETKHTHTKEAKYIYTLKWFTATWKRYCVRAFERGEMCVCVREYTNRDINHAAMKLYTTSVIKANSWKIERNEKEIMEIAIKIHITHVSISAMPGRDCTMVRYGEANVYNTLQ